MTVPATAWQPGMTLTAARLLAKDYQAGQASVTTGSAVAATTLLVTFPEAFPNPPRMSVNIVSGAGGMIRWVARAINVTATGFTLYLTKGDLDQTLSSLPVDWTATYTG